MPIVEEREPRRALVQDRPVDTPLEGEAEEQREPYREELDRAQRVDLAQREAEDREAYHGRRDEMDSRVIPRGDQRHDLPPLSLVDRALLLGCRELSGRVLIRCTR